MTAAAPEPHRSGRGAGLLLEHCAAFDSPDKPRPRAFARLEKVLGRRLARLLLGALVGDHGLSPRDPVG
jgi:hypothetical protein